MSTFERKVMCDECPFRANSLKGWLGPHSIKDIKKIVQSDAIFICHEEIEEMNFRGFRDKEIIEKGQHCIGILRYRNSVCKRSRDKETSQVQDDLKTVPDQDVIPPNKLLEHHDFAQKEV